MYIDIDLDMDSHPGVDGLWKSQKILPVNGNVF